MILEIKKIKTENELKKSYNKIYNKGGFTGGREYFKSMIRFLKLKKNKSKKLLDIGCGDGRLFEYLKSYAQLYGIDISENAINKAKKNFPFANFVFGSAEKLPFKDKSFDYVTYLGTLEHFIDMKKSLKETRRVLKDDGTCLVLVPVLFFVGNILSVAVKGEIPVMQDLDRFGTHGNWKAFLQKNGFKVIKSYKYNIYMPLGLKYFDWKWPFKVVYNILRPLVPFHLSWHFAYIIKKIK